ncbi:hypothetical protein RJT34_11948 [Clitoria ternatea]|uniref:Uncharacterized protein n=1 Tax=Clitoria ternatea TaxID=43366 RepID=A0AAN9JLC0_CLITE
MQVVDDERGECFRASSTFLRSPPPQCVSPPKASWEAWECAGSRSPYGEVAVVVVKGTVVSHGKKTFLALIRDLIHHHKLDFIGLLEPHINGDKALKIMDAIDFKE